jgi:hypothetical protein
MFDVPFLLFNFAFYNLHFAFCTFWDSSSNFFLAYARIASYRMDRFFLRSSSRTAVSKSIDMGVTGCIGMHTTSLDDAFGFGSFLIFGFGPRIMEI